MFLFVQNQDNNNLRKDRLRVKMFASTTTITLIITLMKKRLLELSISQKLSLSSRFFSFRHDHWCHTWKLLYTTFFYLIYFTTRWHIPLARTHTLDGRMVRTPTKTRDNPNLTFIQNIHWSLKIVFSWWGDISNVAYADRQLCTS